MTLLRRFELYLTNRSTQLRDWQVVSRESTSITRQNHYSGKSKKKEGSFI